jgi:NADPH-dependent glutamate synthase beta subunit-like oxidoreductase
MMREGGFDAAFVAVGAQLPKRVDIPAQTATRILDAVRVLRDMETGEPPGLARRVAVYGGGNTALDVARTARRLGSEEARIVYRRTRAQMPAHESEIEEALEEGVLVRLLSTIKRIDRTTLTVERMTLDGTGWPQPTGELETLEAHTVILALGQDADTGFMRAIPGVVVRKDGMVEVDRHMMTGHPGLFAGGDMVPAERTVAVAVGHGKSAARSIDAFLRGTTRTAPPEPEPAAFETLNTWYYTDADRTVQPRLDMGRRRTTFEEVTGGLDESAALFEARRCLSCGNCFECDNCYGLCPDNAVVKRGAGERYRFDYDFCKGCGLCAVECPCGAIVMIPETI